jgi:hypothetical protein
VIDDTRCREWQVAAGIVKPEWQQENAFFDGRVAYFPTSVERGWPWVAQIVGPDRQYGLQREFVDGECVESPEGDRKVFWLDPGYYHAGWDGPEGQVKHYLGVGSRSISIVSRQEVKAAINRNEYAPRVDPTALDVKPVATQTKERKVRF